MEPSNCTYGWTFRYYIYIYKRPVTRTYTFKKEENLNCSRRTGGTCTVRVLGIPKPRGAVINFIHVRVGLDKPPHASFSLLR